MELIRLVNINPIPRHMLIHAIEYEEFVENGNFGPVFAKKEIIQFVLFQPKFKPLKERSKVRFNGTECIVNACDALYDFDPINPHHYEVEVI